MMHGDEWETSREQQEREQRERLEQERLVGVVRNLSRTKDGRYFLRWLVRQAGCFESYYPADHAAAAYREGRRGIGLQVMDLVAAAGAAGTLFEEDLDG